MGETVKRSFWAAPECNTEILKEEKGKKLCSSAQVKNKIRKASR